MPRHRQPSDPAVQMVIAAAEHSLGGSFTVRRTLPYARRRSLGPWVFLDHFGPVELPGSADTDVRPHPHIGLSTVTWLFEGAMVHRDSLGTEQEIRPGALNLMSAGRGIVHSERTPARLRGEARRVHGLQLWLAQPRGVEDGPPSFAHHPELPEATLPGVVLTVIIGTMSGVCGPAEVPSPTLFAVARLAPDADLSLPEEAELGVYLVEGDARVGSTVLHDHELALVTPGMRPSLHSEAGATVAILGGEPLDGPRHMFWNFVHSQRAVVESAAARWREGGFPPVPGDPGPPIPLPS